MDKRRRQAGERGRQGTAEFVKAFCGVTAILTTFVVGVQRVTIS